MRRSIGLAAPCRYVLFHSDVRFSLAVVTAVAGAFFVALMLHLRGWRWWQGWLVSCVVVPLFVLGTVVLRLDGWEWWPVAILFGSIYGAIAGGFGVLVAVVLKRHRVR